ncbi:hypothetical protein CN692_15135 [Bacillus sp. AFS002410]|uniref:hypothetical protein n=1 Tax=Bacillus sp. AFS002410 TaxID=2033481 RepID=UPI000BF11D86|nr:hypothetical protein [Bacillus sp. AFS002410]PEJ56920.1 hypothetical protein CN692_15135 [Bacillus sp. AFS002410]
MFSRKSKKVLKGLLLVTYLSTLAPNLSSASTEKNCENSITPESTSNYKTYSINTFSTSTYYYWKIISKTSNGNITKGDWLLIYEGYPAQGTGEVDSFSFSTSSSHNLTGSINVSNSLISAELGYSIGAKQTFTSQKSSRPLKKGEYVKASYIKAFSRTILKQQKYFYDLGTSSPQNQYASGYSDQAIHPLIKLEYFSSKRSNPEVEYFQFESGEFRQVSEDDVRTVE